MSGYSDSHSETGYSDEYLKTYSEGYYADQWRTVERPLIAEIFSACVAAGAQSMLDVATGTGRILELAEEHFNETTGLDITEEMLQVARARCTRSEIIVDDVAVWEPTRTYDIITAFRFLLNAEEGLRSAALSTMRRAISPEGALIVNIHVSSSSPLGLAYRFRNRVRNSEVARVASLRQLTELLEHNDFGVAHVYRYGYMPRVGSVYPPIAARAMGTIERFGGRHPSAGSLAQAFIVVAKAVD